MWSRGGASFRINAEQFSLDEGGWQGVGGQRNREG